MPKGKDEDEVKVKNSKIYEIYKIFTEIMIKIYNRKEINIKEEYENISKRLTAIRKGYDVNEKLDLRETAKYLKEFCLHSDDYDVPKKEDFVLAMKTYARSILSDPPKDKEIILLHKNFKYYMDFILASSIMKIYYPNQKILYSENLIVNLLRQKNIIIIIFFIVKFSINKIKFIVNEWSWP